QPGGFDQLIPSVARQLFLYIYQCREKETLRFVLPLCWINPRDIHTLEGRRTLTVRRDMDLACLLFVGQEINAVQANRNVVWSPGCNQNTAPTLWCFDGPEQTRLFSSTGSTD